MTSQKRKILKEEKEEKVFSVFSATRTSCTVCKVKMKSFRIIIERTVHACVRAKCSSSLALCKMSPFIYPTSTHTFVARMYHVQDACRVSTYVLSVRTLSVRPSYLGECIPSLVSNSRRKYCRYRLCAVLSYLLIATLTATPVAGRRSTAATHTVHPNSPYARMPPI
jgi:hypothetical protein